MATVGKTAVLSNLAGAINSVDFNLNTLDSYDRLKSALTSYTNGPTTSLGTALDDSISANKYITNWRVLLTEVISQMPNTGPAGSVIVQRAANVLRRQLVATYTLESNDFLVPDITGAEAIVTAYSTHITAFVIE